MTVQDKRVSLKLNIAMNMILTISSFVFPLITFPYVSRVLGPESLGKVSWAASVIAYFNLFAQLGIPTYGIRACAEVRDDRTELSRTVREILFINLIMTAASYILLALGIFMIPKLRAEKTLFVIVGSTIILSAAGMEWMYRGLEQYTYITLRSLLFKLISVAAMFLLVHAPEDYVVYGAVTVLAASASNLCNLFYAGKFGILSAASPESGPCIFYDELCHNDLHKPGYGNARVFENRRRCRILQCCSPCKKYSGECRILSVYGPDAQSFL